MEAVAAANPKTVVILETGSAVLMPWLAHVPAVLEAWYPGEENGNAVADILFGKVNPSGKLPLTFPQNVSDQPAQVEQLPEVTYVEGLLVGYRYYDFRKIEPLFPFGFGLSYTAFKYGNLKISPQNVSPTPNANVSVGIDFDVANTGGVEGAEAAQVYVGKPTLPNGLMDPPDWLKGIQKVSIEPGELKHVHIDLDSRAFSYWDVRTHGWKIEPGAYQFWLGPHLATFA